MSRRTAIRFTLSAVLAASVAAPSQAQLPPVFEPRTGSFQFSGWFNSDEGVPPGPAEVAPMPRAKGGFTFELDVRLTLARTAPVAPMPRAKGCCEFELFVETVPAASARFVPPVPPCCVFDCRPIAAAPAPRAKAEPGQRPNMPSLVLGHPIDLGLPIVKGSFDRGQTFSISPGLFGGPGEPTPATPAPTMLDCRTLACPTVVPPAVRGSVVVQAYPPPAGFYPSTEYLLNPPHPPVIAQTPPVRTVVTGAFTDGSDGGFPPARQPSYPFPIPTGADYGFSSTLDRGVYVAPPPPTPVVCPGCAGPSFPHPLRTVTAVLAQVPTPRADVELVYGRWGKAVPPPVVVPIPRVIVEVIGYPNPGADHRARQIVPPPLPEPAAYPPFAGPGYPPPLAKGAAPFAPPVAAVPQLRWNPTPPANVPAAEFGMMADVLGRMAGVAQSPSTPPATMPSCSGLPPLMPAGGWGTSAPAPATIGGCCVSVPAPRAASAVEKPGLVGTWVREVGPVVFVLKFAPDHLTITASAACEGDDKKVSTEGMVLTAEYHLAKDGVTLVGLITGVDATLDGPLPDGFDLPQFGEEVTRIQKALADKPFAFTVRVYGDELVVGNVRMPEVAGGQGTWCPLSMLGGRYAPPSGKCLPKPRAVKVAVPVIPTAGRELEKGYPPHFSPDPDFPLPRKPAESDRIPPPPPVATVPTLPPPPPVPAPMAPDAPAKGKKGKKKANDRPSTLTPERITGGIIG